ncbi:MAG: Holliday junction resolvase RuvX [Pseudomonadota bacterium]|jgi:putative Holliday junction resolvase
MTAARPAPPASSPPAEPALPRRDHSFLAFDYGLKRTGVASGNTVTWSASPLTTVAAEGKARFAPIEQLIRDWQPDALIVGVPFHPDGAEHANTLAARRFARQLEGRFNLPVIEVDERYSTTEALAAGARDADAFAAALLLQQFFDSQVQLRARAEREALDAAADDADETGPHDPNHETGPAPATPR